MTPPRPASTVLVVRDGPDGIEVAMGLRPPGGHFGGVWVFPGGAVDHADREAADDSDEAWRLAGLRETWEEVGLAIVEPSSVVIPPGNGSVHDRLRTVGASFAVGRMVYLSNWVTPAFVPKRFDTRFYLIDADGPLHPTEELVDVAWVAVTTVVERRHAGELPLMFPTLSHLRYLAGFGDVASVVAETSSLPEIPVVEPRLEEGADGALIVDSDPRFTGRGFRRP